MSDQKAANYFKIAVLIAILIAVAVICLSRIGSFGLTGQAEDDLRKEIESQSGGNIQLSNFRKTDGQSGEILGVKAYSLHFEGQITFSSDGYWLTRNPGAGPGLTFTFSRTPVGFGIISGAMQVHAEDQVKI